MIQTAKFNFRTESSPAKGKSSRKIVIGVVVHVLAAAIYLYVRYLNNLAHHKVMAAASRAVVAAVTSATASTAAASKTAPVTVPMAVSAKPEAQLLAAAAPAPVAVNSSNSVPAKAAPVSLGDSLMAVISPSARAETIQMPLQPIKSADTVAAMPASRQPLKVPVSAQRSVRREAKPLTDAQKRSQVAEAKLDSVIGMATTHPDVFGFASNERVDMAKLGEPIIVYSISLADRKNYEAGQPLKPIMQATNEWIFPVVLNGRTRYMLPVKRVGTEYVAQPGSRALAMVLEKIEERWPASEGYHPQLVVNPKIANYYFTIPELPEQNLTDTGDMFQYNASLSPASVILASWR